MAETEIPMSPHEAEPSLQPRKTILVTGSTGKQGRSLTTALLASSKEHFNILALTRNPASSAAQDLLAEAKSNDNVKVSLVKGDLDDAASIRAVFEDAKKSGNGVWGVFAVLAFPGLGAKADREEKQGIVSSDIPFNLFG